MNHKTRAWSYLCQIDSSIIINQTSLCLYNGCVISMGKYPFYCFVMQYFVYILVSNHLEEERKAGCFAIIVLQMYCYYNYSVTLPHGALGWSAVCDCGIS